MEKPLSNNNGSNVVVVVVVVVVIVVVIVVNLIGHFKCRGTIVNYYIYEHI